MGEEGRLLKGLGPEERGRALRELALASLPHFGLEGGVVDLLQNLVNGSFRVRHESGDWYLRVYDPERHGLVHGDPSFGNILFAGDVPSLIDFDDCGFGHYVYDLAVVLAGGWGKPEFAENRTALLEGYGSVRRLAAEEIAALPWMMAARAASLIFWAAAQSPQHEWIAGQWERLREYMEDG